MCAPRYAQCARESQRQRAQQRVSRRTRARLRRRERQVSFEMPLRCRQSEGVMRRQQHCGTMLRSRKMLSHYTHAVRDVRKISRAEFARHALKWQRVRRQQEGKREAQRRSAPRRHARQMRVPQRAAAMRHAHRGSRARPRARRAHASTRAMPCYIYRLARMMRYVVEAH